MGEIELLRNLHHPNIVEYIGSFKTRSHLYIIMVRSPRAVASKKPHFHAAVPRQHVPTGTNIESFSPSACSAATMTTPRQLAVQSVEAAVL